jgi:hypothetical protein
MTVESLVHSLAELPVPERDWPALARHQATRIRRKRVRLAASGTAATAVAVGVLVALTVGTSDQAAPVPTSRVPAPIIRSYTPPTDLPDIAFGPRVSIPGGGTKATAHLARRGNAVELCTEGVIGPDGGGCGPVPKVAAGAVQQPKPAISSSGSGAATKIIGPIVFQGYAGTGITRVTVVDGNGHERTGDVRQIRASLGVGLYAAVFTGYAPPYVTTGYDSAGDVVGTPVRVQVLRVSTFPKPPVPVVTVTVAPQLTLGLTPESRTAVFVTTAGAGGGGVGSRAIPGRDDLGTDSPDLSQSADLINGSKPARYITRTTITGLSGPGITRVVVHTADGRELSITPHSAGTRFNFRVYGATLSGTVTTVTISGYDAAGNERARWLVTTAQPVSPAASPSIP